MYIKKVLYIFLGKLYTVRIRNNDGSNPARSLSSFILCDTSNK